VAETDICLAVLPAYELISVLPSSGIVSSRNSVHRPLRHLRGRIRADPVHDWGSLFASAPIFHADESRIYCGSSDWDFFDWRRGYLALARLRPDGWAGYESVEQYEAASVETVPLRLGGTKLRRTADVGSNGLVKAAAVHATGQIEAKSAPILETVTDREMHGLEATTETGESGELTRLRFDLNDAKFYSFRR